MAFSYITDSGEKIPQKHTSNPYFVDNGSVEPPGGVTFSNMGWTFVNNDSVTPALGDIVRSSGQNFGAVLAQADSSAHSTGIVGVWDSTPGPGRTGAIKNNDTVEVNCTESVNPGDSLYLSAATAGKATKTAPTYAVFIGNVISVRTVNDVVKATVFWNFTKEELTATQSAAVAALAGLTEGQIPIKNGSGGFNGEAALALANKGDLPVGLGGTYGIGVLPAPATGNFIRGNSATVNGFEEVQPLGSGRPVQFDVKVSDALAGPADACDLTIAVASAKAARVKIVMIGSSAGVSAYLKLNGSQPSITGSHRLNGAVGGSTSSFIGTPGTGFTAVAHVYIGANEGGIRTVRIEMFNSSPGNYPLWTGERTMTVATGDITSIGVGTASTDLTTGTFVRATIVDADVGI